MLVAEYDMMADQQQWHWWYQTKREYLNQLLRQLPLSNSAKILDLGSGVGANFPVLRYYGKVEGAEQSERGRSLSQQHHPETVTAADLNTFTPQVNSFDLITILDVLYHQHIQDDTAVIARALSGLKKDGYLLITDCAHPFLYGPHDEANMARQRYTMAELTRKVEAAGGKVVRATYLFGFSFPLFASARLYQKWRGRADDAAASDGVVNRLLTIVGSLEAYTLGLINIPLGSTICVIAQNR